MGQSRQPRVRDGQLPGQELAFGAVQFEGEHQRMPVFPALLVEQLGTGAEVGKRRRIGCGRLGALAGEQVELGKPLPLAHVADQRRTAIELADDFEDGLLASFRG
ncbi:hypothetical protein FQZ97_1170830 [compost metagenome]